MDRYSNLIKSAAPDAPFSNHTSFDYAFCNDYVLQFVEPPRSTPLTLTIRISFVAPCFTLHWTKYSVHRLNSGHVMPGSFVQSEQAKLAEQRIHAALDSAGLKQLPLEWSNEKINGVVLELAGDNATISKCLFHDFE